MKTMIKVLLIVSLFTLIPMFNALEAAEVYVIGSPTDYPQYAKTVPVDIRVVDSPQYGHILVSITQESSMKGICTNWPRNDDGNTDDMGLYTTDNPKWTDEGNGVFKYEISLGSSTETTYEVPLNVRCFDYGAWGKVTATLYENTGHAFKKRDSHTSTVPRDENGNHIADGWESDFYPYVWSDTANKQVDVGATRAQAGIQDYPYSKPFLGKRQNTVDKETGPTGSTENGDGFTVFEEYRGFMLRSSKPTRFSPATKEVGIVVHNSLSTYGTGNAGYHPLSFHEMSKDYVNEPFTDVWDDTTFDFKTKFFGLLSGVSDDVGWINTNSDGIPDTQRVYAVRVWDVVSPNGAANNSTLGIANRSKPCKYSLINIYVDAITHSQQNYLPTYTLTQVVNYIIGHEVGHTVNLRHCPEVCVNNTTTCMMRPSIFDVDKNWNITQVHVGASPSSYHYIDYDLADPVKSPQKAAKQVTETPKQTPQKAITSSLSASSGVYTAEAGDSHTANFSASSPYSSVYWYVKSPSDTSAYGTTIEIDQGDGSLTSADFTYTFPSDVSGDYQIMAYTYFTDSIVEPSYTVSVSLPSSTETPASETPSTPLSPGLAPTDGIYTTAPGQIHEATLVTEKPYSSVYWYVKAPYGSGLGREVEVDTGDGSTKTATLNFLCPWESESDYVITAYIYYSSEISQLSYTFRIDY